MTTVVGRNILKLLSFISAAMPKIGELLLNFWLYLTNTGSAPPPKNTKISELSLNFLAFSLSEKSLNMCDLVQERHVGYSNSPSIF
jgi:hypothetical protein